MIKAIRPNDKIRLRRGHQMGHYDRKTVNAILDTGYMAHIGYMHDGEPVVTPMLYWRDGDAVYWHGSTASRAMKATIGASVCMTVSHLDGLVLAKSAFHHSANYRSVMLFGQGEAVTNPDERLKSLKLFMDQQFPGRWDKLRPVKDQEMKGTLIARMEIDQFAAKIRTGPPNDDIADKNHPVWSGVIPLRHTFSEAESDVMDEKSEEVPDSVLQHIGRSL